MNSNGLSHEGNHREAVDFIQSEFREIANQERKIREESHKLNELKDQRAFRYFQLSVLKDQRVQMKETHKMLVEKLELCEAYSQESEQKVKNLESRTRPFRTAPDTLALNETYKDFRTAQQRVFRTDNEVSKSDKSIQNNTKDISNIEHQIETTAADITTLEQRLWDLESEAKSTKDRNSAMKKLEQRWKGEGGREFVDWIRTQPALMDRLFNLQEMARFAKWLPNVRHAILLLNDEVVKRSAGEQEGVSIQGGHRGLYPQVMKNAIDRMKHASRKKKPEDADRALLNELISGLEKIDSSDLRPYGLHYTKCGMLERDEGLV